MLKKLMAAWKSRRSDPFDRAILESSASFSPQASLIVPSAVLLHPSVTEPKAKAGDVPEEIVVPTTLPPLLTERPTTNIKNDEPQEQSSRASYLPAGPAGLSAGIYKLPPSSLLDQPDAVPDDDRDEIGNQSKCLLQTFVDLGVKATLGEIHIGPTAMRFEILPGPRVRVEAVMAMQENLALTLGARSIRIVMVPKRSTLGIEIPRLNPRPVRLREILESESLHAANAHVPLAIGSSGEGAPIFGDVARMHHLLVGGATGSGKSVCIDSLVMSMLYTCSPAEVRFVLLDSKLHDLTIYQTAPHMLMPVLIDRHNISDALRWLVDEMNRRFTALESTNTTSVNAFNKRTQSGSIDEVPNRLARIVVVINEIGDILNSNPSANSVSLLSLVQGGAGAGIHLIATATPRPSRELLPGAIKTRFPSRIAFQVPSHWDSRSILDIEGADQLIGRGDLLYLAPGARAPQRGQGTYVSDDEISRTMEFLKQNGRPRHDAH